ncbi:MAG TPA: hypothetical protein VNZ43_06595 [Sphingomonadaceae bacterium]|jgi:hypothetical protein|nr:hypothetical protein [Sphingomonadaceae bacterium]
MIEPFSSWVAFQEEMIKLQQAQLEATKKAFEAGTDIEAARRAGEQAAHAGLKAWSNWLDLWTGRK